MLQKPLHLSWSKNRVKDADICFLLRRLKYFSVQLIASSSRFSSSFSTSSKLVYICFFFKCLYVGIMSDLLNICISPCIYHKHMLCKIHHHSEMFLILFSQIKFSFQCSKASKVIFHRKHSLLLCLQIFSRISINHRILEGRTQ